VTSTALRQLPRAGPERISVTLTASRLKVAIAASGTATSRTQHRVQGN